MKNRTLISLILMCSMFNVYSQRNITQEEYRKIITTDAYYFGRSDFDLPLDAAKKQAQEALIKEISKIEKSISESDLLKRADYVKLEVEDNRTRIIVFIAKDSLYIRGDEVKKDSVIKYRVDEVIVEKQQETKSEEIIEPVITIVEIPEPILVPAESGNEIINTLSQLTDFNNFCTQLNRYKRQGKLFDSQKGTAPDRLENCMMAVFKNDVLEAFYDSGSISRKDFLTGNTIQKPEDDYKNKQGIKVIFIKLN